MLHNCHRAILNLKKYILFSMVLRAWPIPCSDYNVSDSQSTSSTGFISKRAWRTSAHHSCSIVVLSSVTVGLHLLCQRSDLILFKKAATSWQIFYCREEAKLWPAPMVAWCKSRNCEDSRLLLSKAKSENRPKFGHLRLLSFQWYKQTY